MLSSILLNSDYMISFTDTAMLYSKRFICLQEGDNFQSGLVFRENRLAGDPTLPFNSLAMPGYADLSQGTDDHMVMIESNHFRCKCDSVGWVIAAMEHGYQKVPHVLATLKIAQENT